MEGTDTAQSETVALFLSWVRAGQEVRHPSSQLTDNLQKMKKVNWFLKKGHSWMSYEKGTSWTGFKKVDPGNRAGLPWAASSWQLEAPARALRRHLPTTMFATCQHHRRHTHANDCQRRRRTSSFPKTHVWATQVQRWKKVEILEIYLYYFFSWC